jgi:hypothetical protein
MKKNDDSEQESEEEFRTPRSPGRGDFMGGAWRFCRELGKYWPKVVVFLDNLLRKSQCFMGNLFGEVENFPSTTDYFVS